MGDLRDSFAPLFRGYGPIHAIFSVATEIFCSQPNRGECLSVTRTHEPPGADVQNFAEFHGLENQFLCNTQTACMQGLLFFVFLRRLPRYHCALVCLNLEKPPSVSCSPVSCSKISFLSATYLYSASQYCTTFPAAQTLPSRSPE